MHALRRQHVELVAARADVHRFHLLDETGLLLTRRPPTARTHARAVGGRRVRSRAPLRRGPARTLIGTLSVRGLRAVQLFEGALTKTRFALYVACCLAHTLRRGDVLVLDNLPVHHLTGLREWLDKRGIDLVFLPPYSPDFSPIEQIWSKLKPKLCTAQARSHEALQQALRQAIDWITSRDTRNWFNHCGYHTQIGKC